MTKEFPAQRASNAENVSIWWRHHVFHLLYFLQLNCCEEYLPVSWFVAVVLSVEFSLIQQGHFTSSVTMARFPLPVKQPWRIWLNKSNESIRIWWYNHNAATNQSTTKLCVDLSGSPIDFQWGNQRYIKSNLDRYMRLGDTVSPNYNRIGLSLYTDKPRFVFRETICNLVCETLSASMLCKTYTIDDHSLPVCRWRPIAKFWRARQIWRVRQIWQAECLL